MLINFHLLQDLYHLNSTPLLSEIFKQFLKIVKLSNFKQSCRRLATDSEPKAFETLL